MADITQKYIDQLIEFIETTADPASVTNEIMAAILDWLNKQLLSSSKVANDARTAAIESQTFIFNLKTQVTQLTSQLSSLKNDTGILPFDGELEYITDLVDPKYRGGIWYCQWDGIMREISAEEGDNVVGPASGYNRMSGTRPKHASDTRIFRCGNRLYAYDTTLSQLRQFAFIGDNGSSEDGTLPPSGDCACTTITIAEIDGLIEHTGISN